jgi:hypothetical protein
MAAVPAAKGGLWGSFFIAINNHCTLETARAFDQKITAEMSDAFKIFFKSLIQL